MVTLTGVLDLANCRPLADTLDWALEQDSHRTVLDLSGVGLVDRAGVHTILVAYLRASDQRDEFAIIRGPEPVQRVIDSIDGPFEYTTRASLPSSAAPPDQSRPATNPQERRRTCSKRAAADRAKRRGGWR